MNESKGNILLYQTEDGQTKNVFESGELKQDSVVAFFFATVQP